MSNLILDFSHVYPVDAGNRENGLYRVDLSDISGTDMYCTPEAAEEIRRRLSFCGPDGIHFIDSGNYHYVTGFFLEKIPSPFSLVLFDHHNDMQYPMIHELTSCGSWAGEQLRNNSNLQQLILIGPSEKTIAEISSELKEKLVCISMQEIENHMVDRAFASVRLELPAYISIDKDVLNRYEARTNWNQGQMSVSTLERILREIFQHQQVIGVDLCGECSLSEPFPQLLEDEKINRATNRILYHFLSGYLPVRNP